MIQKQTWMNVSDNTTVNWLQVFHLYKGFNRHSTEEGYFIKGSARSVKPPRIEYKGFKFKYNVKGDICRGLILRTRFPNHKFDGSVLYFQQNSCILIKKKQNAKSKYLFGAISHKVRRKKFKTLFKLIL